MSRASEALAEFHKAFGVELDLEQRVTLQGEEHRELDEALTALAEVEVLRGGIIERGQYAKPATAHREAVARELADVIYVAYGTAEALGIDLDVALEAVHAANMAKLPECERCKGMVWLCDECGTPARGASGCAPCGNRLASFSGCDACDATGKAPPLKRADGKVLKPEGWRPADMARAI